MRDAGLKNDPDSPARTLPRRWSRHVVAATEDAEDRRGPLTIGLLPGEGIGPEVIGAAVTVLRALESAGNLPCQVLTGGAIGLPAARECGEALSREVIDFCADIFADGGAVLAGPGGGRFVYELRRQFDLYCKLSPLVPHPALRRAGRVRPDHTGTVDILVVRECVAGVYQGRWTEMTDALGERTASHEFSYSETQVRRILQAAGLIAQERRGELTVIVKPGGIPTISRLWSECARDVARELSICLREIEIDYAVYHLIQDPQLLDVVVTPNLFGDILSDAGGVLLGSRGLCHAGSFSPAGAAVYQTNHGAAHDLAGTDRANPVGQILAMAMLFRESFGLDGQARLIEAAVGDVWRHGYRTRDVAEPGCRIVGTREMADRVADATARLAGTRE
jgi:3-isopropylmalate dehydrogenase